MAKTPATATPAADADEFTFVGVDQSERPKRTGRGGKTMNPEIGRQMLALILSGKDVSDGKTYVADDEHTADENARRVAVKASRYLTAALEENPQNNDEGKPMVAGTRIKNGKWVMFLTNPRERRSGTATA